jgi:hypothetical protein
VTTPDEFRDILASPEGNRIEFKSAAGGYHPEDHASILVPGAKKAGLQP